MKTYLLHVWDNVRTSYWFIPAILASAAMLLSILVPLVDEAIQDSKSQLPGWIHTTTETARSTLSALAGAMIAVTGTVFSITIVSLSLTSQQFGSRLLRRFMYDAVTQMTLGTLLSTAFYCLLILRIVEQNAHEPTTPHLSVLIAVGLFALSMIMLIGFIHRVAMSIQATHVVAAVAEDLHDAIDRLYPCKSGQTSARDCQTSNPGEAKEHAKCDEFITLACNKEGYIQAIAPDGLMSLACSEDVVIRLRRRPGDFVSLDSSLADVCSREASIESLDSDQLRASINQVIIVGRRRTPRQDLECAIEELVEVAVRSLSPGINDPFTAVNCVDRLGAALAQFVQCDVPSPYRYDQDEKLRVIEKPFDFVGALDAAVNQIRQYGSTSVAVTVRLLEALENVAAKASSKENQCAIQRQADMILRGAEHSIPEQEDVNIVRQAHEKVCETLGDL